MADARALHVAAVCGNRIGVAPSYPALARLAHRLLIVRGVRLRELRSTRLRAWAHSRRRRVAINVRFWDHPMSGVAAEVGRKPTAELSQGSEP